MNARRAFSPATLLIVVGLLLILGSGVAWGYRAWDTSRAVASVRENIAVQADNPNAFLRPTFTPTPRPTSTEQTSPSPSRLEAITPTRAPEGSPNTRPTGHSSSPPLTPSPTSSPTPVPTPTPNPPAPPVRLIIPALGIDTPVVTVSIKLVDKDGALVATWQTADYAAGYHEGTALPGQPGNVVISGHNNIKGQVFRPISALGEEDVSFPKGALAYLFDAQGRVFAYAFESMYKVREAGAPLSERIKNARFMAPTTEPVLTLITCWPLNGNTHRIIVRARYVGEVDPFQLQDIAPMK